MPNRFEIKLTEDLNRTTFWLGVVVIVVAVMALLGWVLELDLLRRAIPGLPTMKANTALCFVLAGGVLILARRQTTGGIASAVSRALVVLLALVALLTLSQYIFDWNAGIDEFIYRAPKTDVALPGRMSAATAVIFSLLGGALFLLQLRSERAMAAGQLLAGLALCGALLALLAYVFGAHIERVTAFSSVAVHTAINFVLLSAGALLLRGSRGWVGVFFQDTISSRMARRYMLSVLAALPILAELRIVGQRNLDWYGTYFGIAILTVVSMAVLSVSVWVGTRQGNAADLKISNLARVNATLSGINSLIVRVSTQDELFQEACRISSEVGRFPWVWIATCKPRGNDPLQVQASHVMNDAWRSRLQATLSDGQQLTRLVSPVLRTHEALVIGDLAKNALSMKDEGGIYQQLSALGIRSMLVLPLTVAGEVVGVFVLHSEARQFFDEDEMRLLRELAGDISFAINHIEKEKLLDYLAYYDPLTGLPNRALLLERLGRELHQAGRQSRRVALFMIDLRRFRAINESMGRHAGDDLLCQFTARLQRNMRYPENLARLSADCFASFASGLEAGVLALRVQEVMARVVDEPFVIEGQSLLVGTNVGVAVFPEDASDGESLTRNAEAALQRAQDSGLPLVFYEAGMNASVAESLRLESRLRGALEREEFVLHYQPKVDFTQATVFQVEALIRWNDPENGLVPPGMFIPVMEEMGMIERAGTWAMKRAVADIGRWQAMGLSAPRVAVNISAAQLRSEQFLNTVEETVSGFAGAAPLLDIEVTESMVMVDLARVNAVLHRVRSMGVRIAVDDFGTGYSSLAYLAQLPINALKIDRSFVLAMDEDGPGMAIVASIISLAHSLGLEVVAEGVETQSQAESLRQLKCDLMQGYLFSRPVPFDALVGTLPRAETGSAARG